MYEEGGLRCGQSAQTHYTALVENLLFLGPRADGHTLRAFFCLHAHGLRYIHDGQVPSASELTSSLSFCCPGG